ncbi:MAG: hypothetical protein WAW82_00485 [Candidatus Lutibacillus vidarii]
MNMLEHFDLQLVATAAGSRADEWRANGVSWELHEGPETNKPAAWLILRKGNADGRLTLWTSGEVELEWGSSPADSRCQHREVLDRDDLDRCVDLLAARVRECAG